MKKFLVMLLVLSMMFSLFAACSTGESATSTATEAEASQAADVAEESGVDTPTAEEPTSEESSAEAPVQVETEAAVPEEVDLTGMKAAIIVPMLTVEALQVICDNFVNYLAEYGIEADASSADVSIPRYVELIQNYVADDYDILVVIPLDAAGLEDVVGQARDAGTRIVMLSTVPSYEVDGGLTCDYEATGYAVANMALAWMDMTYPGATADSIGYGVVAGESPEEYKLCKNAMISTIDGSNAGYVAYISGEIGGSVDAGYSFAQEALTADPNIRIFVCNEPDTAKGISNYLVAQENLNLDEYAVLAINTDQTAAQMVEQSKTNETVLRGLIPYGSDDTGLVASQIVVEILSGTQETPYWVHDEIFTLNSFGWEYTTE